MPKGRAYQNDYRCYTCFSCCTKEKQLLLCCTLPIFAALGGNYRMLRRCCTARTTAMLKVSPNTEHNARASE
jgi:hypothetical protein